MLKPMFPKIKLGYIQLVPESSFSRKIIRGPITLNFLYYFSLIVTYAMNFPSNIVCFLIPLSSELKFLSINILLEPLTFHLMIGSPAVIFFTFKYAKRSSNFSFFVSQIDLNPIILLLLMNAQWEKMQRGFLHHIVSYIPMATLNFSYYFPRMHWTL